MAAITGGAVLCCLRMPGDGASMDATGSTGDTATDYRQPTAPQVQSTIYGHRAGTNCGAELRLLVDRLQREPPDDLHLSLLRLLVHLRHPSSRFHN